MTFFQTVTAAVNDILVHGFDSVDRVDRWLAAITEAARAEMIDEGTLEGTLRSTLSGLYRRWIEQGRILDHHPGVSRFTLAKVAPRLRDELDKRMITSASLIRLNREEMIERTRRRFQGWATSIPPGGVSGETRNAIKAKMGKALRQLPFEERRVMIDQGHKLNAALSDVLAQDAGAIAMRWHSHWRQRGYDYREDHKERDGVVYLIRDSWAHAQGLVKPDQAGYLDAITQPAQEVFCRCYGEYLYALSELPTGMLTRLGTERLAKARELVDL